MLRILMSGICLRKECKERCGVPRRAEINILWQIAIEGLILVLIFFFIGWSAGRLHAQDRHFVDPPAVIGLTMRTANLESLVKDLAVQVAAIKSEEDHTQGVGIGIGLAVGVLQLLGFFVKSKQNG